MTIVVQFFRLLLSMAILLALFVSPIIAAASAVMLFKLREKHRLFLHMAVVKAGMALGFCALVISEAVPGAKGFQIHLNGWHGWWFIGGMLTMVLPLARMMAYLLGLMRNGIAES